MFKSKKDLCEICGKSTVFKRCSDCWKVEIYLPEYIKNPKGLKFVQNLIKELK